MTTLRNFNGVNVEGIYNLIENCEVGTFGDVIECALEDLGIKINKKAFASVQYINFNDGTFVIEACCLLKELYTSILKNEEFNNERVQLEIIDLMDTEISEHLEKYNPISFDYEDIEVMYFRDNPETLIMYLKDELTTKFLEATIKSMVALFKEK